MPPLTDRRKTPLGRFGGPKPSKYNPNPATCAAGSEALRSKVSLHVSPAAPQAQGKRVLAEKAGSAGLFRQAERDGCMPSLKKILISPLHSAARCGQPARRGPGSGAQRLFSARRGGPGAARRQTPGVRSSPGGYGPASFPRLWMFPRRLRRRGTHFRPSSPTQPLRRCAARQPR